ncbi:hypothetical protein [Luteipulveratus mongoliensis]|uniref:Uncharacterized protein n=1 Tax=Luteipulveratus mongoliensis TaxID=571913 RepID=A0A0K1JGB0_9MICO|nr:hypothetical protein [Luteipulveratus mongoliensis]AKU15747.1 hypothetical protein VV02_07600 [Luteipulveratus mongoliensis]
MATVKHPTLKNVSQDVPDADVAEWVQAGWISERAPEATPPSGDDMPLDELAQVLGGDPRMVAAFDKVAKETAQAQKPAKK